MHDLVHPMKTQHPILRKLPHAALAAILSLSLVLRPAYAVDPTVGIVLNGSFSLDGAGSIIDGNSANGYFLRTGDLTLSNVTLQNFAVKGGDGSGGGAGMGGALFINSGTTVELNSVNFLSNNAAGGNGGVGSTGGTLNNLFSNSNKAANGDDGREFLDTFLGIRIFMNDGNGGDGFHAANGATGGSQVAGGNGGNGGAGGDGWDIDPINTALAAFYTSKAIIDAIGGTNPATEPAGVAQAAAESASSSAQAVTYGLQAAAYVAMNQAGYVGFGGGGGNGGVGGNGGEFNGGGKGGNGGSGGDGAGGASGGGGGDGGPGGVGGFGAGGGQGGNGGAGGAEGSSFAGLAGGGGEGGAGGGGSGGFGGGAGASGLDNLTPQAGGEGGNGFGGAIFIRTGGMLTITGNSLFDGNGVRSGDGQARADGVTLGQSGIGAGTDLFLMKGATLILDADKYSTGNVITFNGDAYGTGIADDSAASIIPSGGPSPIPSGDGADVIIRSGLVQFVGGNLYSGQTKIEGGTLQAQDGEGIYWDSNINFDGTPASNAVLMMNGDFTRYVGTQSNRVQWTGSGGFAASGGDLNVRMSDGQTMIWGSASFVPDGNALVFGSTRATNKVNFENNINLSGGNRSVLVKANEADAGNNVEANIDWAVFNGVISNGSLSINDTNHTGKVVLAAENTYTGSTTINAGTVEITGSVKSTAVSVASGATLDSPNGGLDATTAVTNAGTLNLGATNDTIASLTNTGTLNGTGTLTAATYNLNDGSVLNAKLGTGTLNTAGAVTLNGTVGASTVNVATGSTLNLQAPELILDSASVTVNGILNLNGGDETFQTLLGAGTVNTNANKLVVADGSAFTGTLNAPNTDLSGGSLAVGGGTTTTDSTTVQNNLTVTGGGTLDSNTITVNSTGTLNIANGNIVYDTLNGLGPVGGTVNTGGSTFINPNGSTVKGFLTFTGDFTNNGVLAPGASPGITVVGGNFVNAGTLDSEIGGLGGAGVDPGGFDQTQVGGTATVGGTLNVQGFNNFLPAQGNRFQIISNAIGGPIRVIGTFAAVTFDADGVAGAGLPVANAATVFDVNTGAITATGLNNPGSTFAQLGSNANQSGAANAIFSSALVGQNQIDSATIAGALALQVIDATGGSAADLARYVPDYYGSIADYAFLGDQVLARGLQDRVSMMNYANAGGAGEDSSSQVPEHMSFFFGYMNSSLDTADNAQVRRNDYYAGVNLIATEQFVVGIAGSMSDGSISAPLGQAEVEGFGAMLYARATLFEDWTVFGSLGYSNQDFDLTRSTVNGTATGSTDAATWTGVIGVQHKGWHWGEVSIAPRVSLTYSKTDVGGFSESGPIDALRLGDWSATRLVAEAGVSALWSTELAGRPFSLEGSLAIQQSLQNNKDRMQAAIISVPTASYPVSFAESADTQAVVRVNASYAIAKAVSVYTGYEGSFGGETAHHVKAGFRINF